MEKPEVKIMAVSNVYCRLMHFQKKGDQELGHYHEYDHGTLLAKGKIQVEILNDEGETISSKEFVAPSFIFVAKDKIHRITALEDDSIATCIHALREIDENIVSPDYFVEERILADEPEEMEGSKLTMGYEMITRGMLYKPLTKKHKKD